MRRLPHLNGLMDAYFHQDYDLGGDDDAAVLASFARSAGADAVAATIAEIDTVLAEPVAGLLDRFRLRTGEWNMLIGNDDASARVWLLAARQVLVDAPCLPTPLAARVVRPTTFATRLGATNWGGLAIAQSEFPALTDLAGRFLSRRDIYPDDAAALADYTRTNWPETIAEAATECDRFIALPAAGAGRRWAKIVLEAVPLDDAAARRQVETIRRALRTRDTDG